MKRTLQPVESVTDERKALRKRLKQFYLRFNKANWDDCFALIDPLLTHQGKVNREAYPKLMQDFKDVYGRVKPWVTRLSLHPEGAPKQGDKRPFAYIYVIWQDAAHGFHMFRERWIKEDGPLLSG